MPLMGSSEEKKFEYFLQHSMQMRSEIYLQCFVVIENTMYRVTSLSVKEGGELRSECKYCL
jgi:hypothetical protein